MPEKNDADIENFVHEYTRKVVSFFDKIEDRARGYLSHHPIWYALVAGIGVVLFWRGIWGLADESGFSSLFFTVISILILLLTGTFVSFFIGDQILMSGLKAEKRLSEKTEKEVRMEEEQLVHVFKAVEEIRQDMAVIKESLAALQTKPKRKTSPFKGNKRNTG